jgi:hypothetical protein
MASAAEREEGRKLGKSEDGDSVTSRAAPRKRPLLEGCPMGAQTYRRKRSDATVDATVAGHGAGPEAMVQPHFAVSVPMQFGPGNAEQTHIRGSS